MQEIVNNLLIQKSFISLLQLILTAEPFTLVLAILLFFALTIFLRELRLVSRS